MVVKEERRIKFSVDQVEEPLVTQPKLEEDNMETAKVKMAEVREENERLRLTLSQMMKDYHSLKRQFNGKIQEDDDDDDDQFKKLQTSLGDPMAAASDESELVSLSLGRFSPDTVKKTSKTESKNLEICKLDDGLELGLDWKSHLSKSTDQASMILNPGNSSDESKEEETNDVGSSRKSPKNARSEDDETLQHNPLKKPRVSVRAVCNTQTMHDGCQWRKYGQKISKGNPCPRAYYRCTVSSSCPVRKQVQRCMEDMRILITTYEGTHNHPLPASATTMASTTSAAAAMLNCGSTTSPPYHGGSATSAASTSPNHFGYNYASPNNLITFSSSQSHPTVILDLTAPNHNKFSSTSSTHSSLNFSSSNSCYDLKYPSISNMSSPYSQPSLYTAQKQAANDQKIAAATKAITSDPNFQSALAAAITSFVGTNSVHGRNSGLNSNSHLNFSQPSTSNGSVGCATSLFLNKFPQSVNSQQKNLITHFAPLSTSKSQPISSVEEGEEIKLL